MKFEVKFRPASFARNLDLIGPGAVYLDETGIVVEGDIPRIYVPLVYRILRQIICATGVRTIPFSKIVQYRPPSLWKGGVHQIQYVLPDKSRKTVSFKMRHRRNENNNEFTTRFAEYRAAAQSFSHS